MSRFGIIVEGPCDASVYSAMIPRIRPEIADVVARACGGVPALTNRFVGLLKHFQYMDRIDKALVIRDSDRRDPQVVEKGLRDRLDESGFRPTFPVHFYATKSMVETWLLADINAIVKTARGRGHSGSVKPMNRTLEEIIDPKAAFHAMLSQAGLPADPKVYGEIATEADIDIIEGCCPYFLKFREHIHAC